MHPLLVEYLAQIKPHLKALPVDEQELQLEEIAQHLHALASELRASGLAEIEAVQTATARFSKPKSVGREIVAASGGRKMGILAGLAWGALAGALALAGPELLCRIFLNRFVQTGSLLFVWDVYRPLFFYAIVSGAVASLVGRRFARFYLGRPARLLTFSEAASHGLRLGLGRGAVAGLVFSVLVMSRQSLFWDPQNLWLIPVFAAICCLKIALIAGCSQSALSMLQCALRPRLQRTMAH